MKLGHRCTVCGQHVDESELIQCDQCGNQLHSTCEEFETKYECGQCGTELWVGAVEF